MIVRVGDEHDRSGRLLGVKLNGRKTLAVEADNIRGRILQHPIDSRGRPCEGPLQVRYGNVEFIWREEV